MAGCWEALVELAGHILVSFGSASWLVGGLDLIRETPCDQPALIIQKESHLPFTDVRAGDDVNLIGLTRIQFQRQ